LYNIVYALLLKKACFCKLAKNKKKENNMKTKKLEKKLVLTKATVVNLESKDMNALRGGCYTMPMGCNTEYLVCTNPKFCDYSYLCM
jgi:hypothetical protein